MNSISGNLSKVIETALTAISKDLIIYPVNLENTFLSKENRREELLAAVENIVLELVRSLAENRPPVLRMRSRGKWGNTCLNQMVDVGFVSQRSRMRFAVLVHTLGTAHRLLSAGQTCTRRELYYADPAFFGSQSVVDNAVRDVCCLLGAPGWELGILATSKGLVAGPATLRMRTGETVDCNAPGGVLIPQHVYSLERVETSAKFILLVEKDAAFQKLLDEDFLSRLGPCLLITGKGFPDVCTRVLVHRLWDLLRVPILALVDADPYGIEIMCVYRFGSLSMAHQANLAVPAIRWLGLHAADICQHSSEAQPLSAADRSKLRHLAERTYITSNPELQKQVQLLLSGGSKVEIECTSSVSSSYLTDVYIPGKIRSLDIL